MNDNKDYYNILGVDRGITQEDLKKTYKKLSKKYHPDKKGGNEEKFKEISEAYNTLGDEQKRREYDMGGRNPFGGHQHHGGGPGMDDIFKQFFGGQRQQQRVRKGKSLNIPLTVTLDEVFHGRSKTLKYNRNVNCLGCGGNGGQTQTCNSCGGRGWTERMVGNAFFRQVQKEQCNRCQGRGSIVIKACNTCNGVGHNKKQEIINFSVPTDLQPGQAYAFNNRGDEIPNGQAGDLTIEVVIARHKDFKIHGKDLIYEPKVSIIDMILGSKIEIPYFNTKLSVDVPPRSDVDSTFNLRGKGMKRLRDYDGNLLIKPKVVMPKSITEDEHRILESLRERDNFKIRI
jgi:molecular chaperone DnaJ